MDENHLYSDKILVIFDTHININLRCSHGYTNCVIHTDLITWVFKNSWKTLLSEFSHAERIITCLRTIICNKCEQNKRIGEILNAGDNVYDQEDFGFTGSYFKISPTVIDDYTKNKFLNMQQEHMIPQRSMEKNDKRTDGIYQKILIDNKESDERDQISESDKEK